MSTYPGRVVKLDPAGPLVQVPLLAQHVPFGPLPSTVPNLEVGERVIVASLGHTRDQLNVIGRVPGRAATIDEIPGLEGRFEQVEGRLDSLEDWRTSAQGTLDGYGGRISSLESRATSIEGVNETQNQRLDALESGSASDTALAQLRADTAGRVTTKGDLLVGTGPGVLTRQPVPGNGLVLVGDTTQATGWAPRDVLGMPRALAGATAPTRYVGATASGPPSTGSFIVGDFVVDGNGVVWWCTTAGTPGAWTNAALTTPMGHCGATAGFQPISDVNGAYALFSAAQVLRGGMTFGSNGLTVPKTGLYRVSAKSYFTGGTNYQGLAMVTRNSAALPPPDANVLFNAFVAKTDSADYSGFASAVRTLTAGDVLRLWLKGASSTWGGDGYNGSYLEAEYLDQ